MKAQIEAPRASYRVPTGAEVIAFCRELTDAGEVGRAMFISPLGHHLTLNRIETAGPDSVRLFLEHGRISTVLAVHQLSGVFMVRPSFSAPYAPVSPTWGVKGGDL
jgi:hypothetical protein